MRIVEVNFAQRVHLVNLLSMQEGTIGKLAPLMRILDQIRFSEEEDKQITRTPVGNDQVTFVPPNPEFGKLTASIEDGDASMLSDLLANWTHFRAADGVWVIPLQQSLQNNGTGGASQTAAPVTKS
jgi:hypothetical protein